LYLIELEMEGASAGSLGPHTEVNEGFRRVGPDVQEFRLAPPPGRQQIAPPSWASRLPSPPTSRMPSPPASSKFLSPSSATTKIVWVWTRSKDVMRRAVEAGWTTFIFTPEMKHVAPEWTCNVELQINYFCPFFDHHHLSIICTN
jgi:hypothetical protein